MSSFLSGLKSVKMTKSRENGQTEAINSLFVGLKFMKIALKRAISLKFGKIAKNRAKRLLRCGLKSVKMTKVLAISSFLSGLKFAKIAKNRAISSFLSGFKYFKAKWPKIGQ